MSNAAAAIAGELLAEAQAEGGLADADEPTPDLEPTEEPEAEASLDDGELPADIEALLAEDDEPDPEEDDEVPAAEGEWEYQDIEQERIRAHKAEKKAAHLEKQLLVGQRKDWQKEIAQHFKYADPKIAETATSRRDALKQAKAEHDLALRGADATKAYYEENLDKIIAERVAEAEAKVKATWGVPIEGPGQAPAVQSDRAASEEEIRNATSLHERLKLKIQNGLLNP